MNNTVSHIDRTLVNTGAQLTANIQKYYSLFLWDLEASEVLVTDDIDPAARTSSAEYFFEVPPKVQEISEPFATKIVSTQNGGKYVESYGSIYKNIRVQGTTGLRPRKKAPNKIPLLNTDSFENVLSGPDFLAQVRQIPESEYTGFDDIHFLRNIFRKLSDLRTRGRKIVLVWRNIKDDDYWIVEPKEFKLTQNSKSPLTYNYQMNLQGIAKFESTLVSTSLEDPQFSLRDVRRFASRMQEYQQDLTQSFLVISTQINRIQGAGYVAVDSLINPLTGVIKGIASVNTSATQSVKGLFRAVDDGITQFADALDVLNDSLEPINDENILERRDPLIRQLRRSQMIFYKILGEKKIKDNIASDAVAKSKRLSSSYNKPGTGTSPLRTPRTGGSPSFIGNSISGQNVSEGRVGRGESIRDLASRTLGDARRWHEIVVLNDLKSPYTTDSSTPVAGVLSIGDVFYYPSTTSGINPSIINPVNVTDNETEGVGAPLVGEVAAQAYGRDIRLKSVSDGSNELVDLAINQQGDISTISGIPNVEQAVKIRFSTESGELPSHPNFGARFPIGTKADISSFNTYRINTIATMRSDPRVLRIRNLRFGAIGDVLTVNAELVLQNDIDYLSTSFALRRF